MGQVSDTAYLRFPHLYGDLLCFAAEDDIWVAPLGEPGGSPGRAWRVTADRTRVGAPRFSPDGTTIAFTNWRSLDPEVYLVPVNGGTPHRLTYWGSADTRVCSWTPDGHVLAVSSHGQPFAYRTWAHSVPTDRECGPGGPLPWGPVSDIAVHDDADGERRTLLLTGTPPHQPHAWKRYRGGATGRLWLHGERLVRDLPGHLASPMFVAGRIAFLSDHEGIGNLYSCLPDGTDLRRHTDHADFYARNASTDGRRVVYQCAGELWAVEDLVTADGRPRRLEMRLGGPRNGRRSYQVPAATNLDSLAMDGTGRASAVCVRGSLYWLTHRDGPAHTISDVPGSRVRLPKVLGDTGLIAYVTDAAGEDGIELAPLPGRSLTLDMTIAEDRAGYRARAAGSRPDEAPVGAGVRTGSTVWGDRPAPDEPAEQARGTEHAATPDHGREGRESQEQEPEPGERPDHPDSPDSPDSPGARLDPGDGAPSRLTRDDTASGSQSMSGTGSFGAADGGSGTDDSMARLAAGRLGRVTEMVPSPDGGTLAVASHDGRLLLVATGEGESSDEGLSYGDSSYSGLSYEMSSKDRTAGGGLPTGGQPGRISATTTAGRAEDMRSGLRADSRISRASAGDVVELIRSTNGPVRDLAFSPDSAWLTWSHPGVGRSLRSIKIARLADHTIIDVTDGRFEDEQPVFTRDGCYLAFLSWRGFDPVYDVHTGDLSFPLGCRPYLVPLNSATPSPFALRVEGSPVGEGLDPMEGMSGGPVVVEAEGLPSRVTPFPVPASKYSALEPVRGGLVWLRWPISGALGETFVNPTDPSPRPTLEFFHLGRARRTELVRHMDWYAVSGDGLRLAVFDAGELAVIPATERSDDESTVYVDMRRILHEVEPTAEWRQSYAEAGRLIRDYFWAPDMGGVDWPAILDQYRPLVERVATPDEFADLLREVLGELGTSHAYVQPARRNEGPPHYQRPIGLLGADFRHNKDGSWTIARILPGDSSDSKARSPLAGTGLREGDVLTHVDGRPVDPRTGPFPLLDGAGGTTVELTFIPCGGRAPRRVAVVPLVDDRPLRYQHWVTLRRSIVRHLSGGRCGYLHIPDLGGSGWAQFNRDLRKEVAFDALIVDVRGNAGGNISELVIEKLTRKVLGWDLTRNAQPVSYASSAPRGPVVALADEATSSDGDMITAAFQLLGLGPVVGLRTWGGVVGITGRHRLGDNTVITVPMNAAWFDAYGWSVENRGVSPDIECLRTPVDWAEGRQGQLNVAVRTALSLLEQHPAAVPPDLSGRPDRTRPHLPPR